MPQTQVSGDVFIGRYFDNEEDFRRMDFTQAELSSSAAWIREAKAQILRRSERGTNAQQLMQQLKQPKQAPASSGGGSAAAPQSPSEAEKAKGNEVGGQTAVTHVGRGCISWVWPWYSGASFGSVAVRLLSRRWTCSRAARALQMRHPLGVRSCQRWLLPAVLA